LYLDLLVKITREDNTLLLFGRLDLRSLKEDDPGPKNKRKSSIEDHPFENLSKKLKKFSIGKTNPISKITISGLRKK